MLSAFKVLDPHYERSKYVLLSWQVDFATFLKESKRDIDEVKNTMAYALSDSFWITRIFNPINFINAYQTLYKQRINKSKTQFSKQNDNKQFRRPCGSKMVDFLDGVEVVNE